MKWLQHSQEVYGASSNIVFFDNDDIATLKKEVLNCPNQRIRICAHPTSDDALHEMLIVIAAASYIRPHKHTNKSESFHMIEGDLDVVIFNDAGDIIKIIPMGNPYSGKNFFYRLSTNYFHTLIIRSEIVVFHETTRGPWKKEDTQYADWSPTAGDKQAEQLFLKNLQNKIIELNA